MSVGADQLALVAFVPEALSGELACEDWLRAALSVHPNGAILSVAEEYCIGRIALGASETARTADDVIQAGDVIQAAHGFLRSKDLVPEARSDDDDDLVFGDDDFPA